MNYNSTNSKSSADPQRLQEQDRTDNWNQGLGHKFKKEFNKLNWGTNMGSNQTMVNLEFRPLEDVPKSRETNGNGQGHVQNLTQCVKPSSEEISKSEGDAAYLPRKNTTITQNRNSSQVPDQSIDRREASGGLSAPPHQEGSTSEMSENFPNLPASSQNPLRIEQGKPTKEIFKEMGYWENGQIEPTIKYIASLKADANWPQGPNECHLCLKHRTRSSLISCTKGKHGCKVMIWNICAKNNGPNKTKLRNDFQWPVCQGIWYWSKCCKLMLEEDFAKACQILGLEAKVCNRSAISSHTPSLAQKDVMQQEVTQKWEILTLEEQDNYESISRYQVEEGSGSEDSHWIPSKATRFRAPRGPYNKHNTNKSKRKDQNYDELYDLSETDEELFDYDKFLKRLSKKQTRVSMDIRMYALRTLPDDMKSFLKGSKNGDTQTSPIEKEQQLSFQDHSKKEIMHLRQENLHEETNKDHKSDPNVPITRNKRRCTYKDHSSSSELSNSNHTESKRYNLRGRTSPKSYLEPCNDFPEASALAANPSSTPKIIHSSKPPKSQAAQPALNPSYAQPHQSTFPSSRTKVQQPTAAFLLSQYWTWSLRQLGQPSLAQMPGLNQLSQNIHVYQARMDQGRFAVQNRYIPPIFTRPLPVSKSHGWAPSLLQQRRKN